MTSWRQDLTVSLPWVLRSPARASQRACSGSRDAARLEKQGALDSRAGDEPSELGMTVRRRRATGVYLQPFSNPHGTTRVAPYRLLGRDRTLPRCGRHPTICERQTTAWRWCSQAVLTS